MRRECLLHNINGETDGGYLWRVAACYITVRGGAGRLESISLLT
jgi:hypothetical protein